MKYTFITLLVLIVFFKSKAQQSEFVQWGAVGATINQPVIDIHAAYDMSMFLMEDSTIRMAGIDCSGLRANFEKLEKVVYITTNAAITSDGVAHLVYSEGVYSNVVNVKKVVKIESYFLLLMENGDVLKSLSKDQFVNLNLANVKDVFSGGEVGGVIYQDGTVTFLDNLNGFQMPQEINQNIKQIDLAAIFNLKILIVREDSTLIGYDAGQVVNFPETLKVQSITCDDEAGFAYLKTDGTCGTWGRFGLVSEADVQNLSNVKAIGMSYQYFIGLKEDGALIGLDDGFSEGQVQFHPDLTNIKDLSYGENHNLAVKDDGSVIAWGGHNLYGELDVPLDLSNVIQVAALERSSVALKKDGSLVVWGDTSDTSFPFLDEMLELNNIVKINHKSYDRFMALLSNGKVWISLQNGESGMISFVPNLIDVDDNGVDFIGLTQDKKVITWSRNDDLPTEVEITNVIDVGVSQLGFMALRSNGKISQWGSNTIQEVSFWENVKSIDVSSGVMALHEDGSISAYSDYSSCHSRVPMGLGNVSRIKVFSNARFGAFVDGLNRFVEGQLFNDKNQNCIKDDGEEPIAGVLLELNSSEWFTLTSFNGFYKMPIDTVSTEYVIKVIENSEFKSECVTGSPFIVPEGKENYVLNIGGEKLECTHLSTSISGAIKRRCFPSKTTIGYCNGGSLPSGATTLTVDYPQYLVPLSSIPMWSSNENGVLTYDFDGIKANECGSIIVLDSVVCGIEVIRGLTQCIKSRIGPSEYCAAISSEWDQVELELTKKCEDGVVNYKVANNTTFDMSDSTAIQISINDTLVRKSRVKLKAFTDTQIDVNAFGDLISIEVGQTIGFPEDSILTDFVEGCIASTQTLDDVVKGLALNKPFVPQTSKETKSCFTITGSYDPNDKQAVPVGLTDAHYVLAGTSIDYTIRFQNTGTDTAFKVVLVDTLDSSLDISTFMQGASSHPYSLKVSGKGNPILTFTFNNILLPDSNVNVLASNGFVSFKINTFSNLSDETIIENEAAIYFDYNSPVITNTVYHTIGEPKWEDFSRENLVTIGDPKPLETANSLAVKQSMVYPNPTTGVIYLQGAQEGDGFEVHSVLGEVVYRKKVTGKTEFSVHELPKGIYIYQLHHDGKVVDTGKLIRD